MLTASQILEVWEHGRSQTPVQRALSLLALALPENSERDLERCGIGRRDRELLALRQRIFGPRLTASAQCPACGEMVEADFAVTDIQTPASADEGEELPFRTGEFELRFRLPTCGDLAGLDPRTSIGQQKKTLLHCCVTGARQNGNELPTDSLPDHIVAALSDHMAQIDPQGDIQLALNCPKCAHRWEAVLDIASYLWTEINAWAVRTLREIHVIAVAYGWTEPEILKLSPWRRQAYLEMIQS
jgi:hypothetical protein